jgi:thiol-disulfide isomerase/thioredoxin
MQYICFISIAFLFFACDSQANKVSVEEVAEAPNIEIQVEGLSSGTAFMIGIFTDQQFKVDSAQIDATGKMTFSREEPYKKGFCVVFLPNNQSIQMLLDTDQTFTMKTQAASIIPAMQVEGSVDNELLYQNLNFQLLQQPKFSQLAEQRKVHVEGSPEFEAIKEQENQLVAERKAHLNELFTNNPNSFFTVFKKAGQNPDAQDVRNPDGTINSALQVYLYRSEFWNDVDFKDERLLYTPVISNKLSRYIKELTPQHPDSIRKSAKILVDQVLDSPEYFKYFANWITLNYEPTKTTLMDPEAVYVFMVQNYFTHERAFWSDSIEVFALQQRANEMAGSLIGHKALDVKSTDINGQSRSIYEIEAPYVVIFMFNPDCDHCQEESPKLVQFYREWKSKGVEVFTIALDTEEAEWRSFVKSSGLPGIHVFDPTNRSIYGKYYVDNTPEIYVLNADRTIIGKNLKVEQIANIIERDKEQ